MKGVLICGGTGSRLRPLTNVFNKSLLPVYHRPLILYPLEIMQKAGIEQVIVITGTEHIDQITRFLGSGSRYGCRCTYRVQEDPKGIAQALGMAEEFAAGDSVCAILGDNVFFDDLSPSIKSFQNGGHVFLKEVPDPERFGVVEVDGTLVKSVEEKPLQPKSNLAQTGCYLYDNRCFDVIKNLKPSPRGELEITDVTRWYLDQNELGYTVLNDEWVDAGTFESLFKASALVRNKERLIVDGAKDEALKQSTVNTSR
ncbi:MAG: sugar phosphate nucleotidyltransferase [Candidatus Peribacteraceae bacterium]|jgi:glucose-1-phosphate thymidylyltransferase|nr:sugar phosphate nucleotidyltransferase [Candidatus Peribacteraceae bacterium]MDP7454702.1 sugar phosphate nucleotidyltransferase [Candidatus Peribacteraceae bacterium]MDP7646363.1 sugar phosphate nucleotidyltransferase [Candidatus Peribacteraceae bacterium]|tara:strand:+ start:1992 stop:2759 length:768 start_codon:yes stop_codon:yes gene_type:complete